MEMERVQDYKDDIKMLKDENRDLKERFVKIQSESETAFKDQFQLKEQLRIVSDGARRDQEQSIEYMHKCKTYEHENKQLHNIQDNLSTTLNRVKVENETIINSIKSNLTIKENEYQRLMDEIQDKNNSTKYILDQEKENSTIKLTLMNNTLTELKDECSKKTNEHQSMLYDNRKLFQENENLKRLIRVQKEKMDSEYDVNSQKQQNQDPSKETTIRKQNWSELDQTNIKLKEMIDNFTTDIKTDQHREEMSKDESGLTRGDVSVGRSNFLDDSKYQLPTRSAVLEDIKNKSDSKQILQIDSYKDQSSLNLLNLSKETLVVREETTDRKEKEDIKDDDFKFG